MHKKLKEPEKELRAQSLLEAAPDAMVVVDETGKIVLVNNQTERLFGYQRDELVGRNVEELLAGTFPQQTPDTSSEFLRGAACPPNGSQVGTIRLAKRWC